jgi:hypothetical protein
MEDKKKYQTTKTNRFYPGRISEERVRQLESYLIPIDELTTDDIVFNLTRARTAWIYALLGYIERKWGEKEAEEAATTVGYYMGRAQMKRRLQALGTDRQTAEQMAHYQDLNHVYGGVTSSDNYSEYDDENVMIHRNSCAFHSLRPPGMKSYCRPIIEGYIAAYKELDKGIIGFKDEACLCKGDDHCYGGFIYKKP